MAGETVELAYVDQRYTGWQADENVAAHGIRLYFGNLPEAKRSFVLLSCRWVVERLFGWLSRLRRLARECERLSEMLAGLHVVAFVILMLAGFIRPIAYS